LQIVRFIQSFANPVLDVFFICVTTLGSDEFLMIFLASMYWSVDKGLGYLSAMTLLASAALNNLVKDIVRAPRPATPAVRVVFTGGATGFSFPSGHTQNVVTFWGVLSRETRARSIIALSALIIPLVGLSRMYLGVHWPVDVLGGLLFGGMVVALYPSVIQMGQRLLDGAATQVKAILPVVLSLIFLAADFTLDAAKIAGFIAGFGAGAVVEAATIGFSEGGPRRQRIRRFLLGAILVLAVRYGLKVVLPDTVMFTYLRYVAVGLAGGLGAPAVFVRLGLADRR
jgi:membrane-associated phospholipid phosphatase